MDTDTVAAAVLHDTIEDEDRVLILRADEVERVAVVVDGPSESRHPEMGVLHARWIPETSRFPGLHRDAAVQPVPGSAHEPGPSRLSTAADGKLYAEA